MVVAVPEAQRTHVHAQQQVMAVTTHRVIHILYVLVHAYVAQESLNLMIMLNRMFLPATKYARIFHALLHVCPLCGDSYSLTTYCIRMYGELLGQASLC